MGKQDTLCDCGCGKPSLTGRTVTVTAEHRQLSETELRTRSGKRWNVLPECEEPFKRELNAAAILRTLAHEGEKVSWLKRFFISPMVFYANYLFRRRNSTWWATVKQSAKVALVFGTPKRLSDWLAKRWSPKPQPSGQAFVPTVVPSHLCGTSSGRR